MLAPRPMASLARAPSAPKLMPAIVIGISSSTGFLANRVPRTVRVVHVSRYPSSGYRLSDAVTKTRSSKWGTFRLAPIPRMSYRPSSAAFWIHRMMCGGSVWFSSVTTDRPFWIPSSGMVQYSCRLFASKWYSVFAEAIRLNSFGCSLRPARFKSSVTFAKSRSFISSTRASAPSVRVLPRR